MDNTRRGIPASPRFSAVTRKSHWSSQGAVPFCEGWSILVAVTVLRWQLLVASIKWLTPDHFPLLSSDGSIFDRMVLNRRSTREFLRSRTRNASSLQTTGTKNCTACCTAQMAGLSRSLQACAPSPLPPHVGRWRIGSKH